MGGKGSGRVYGGREPERLLHWEPGSGTEAELYQLMLDQLLAILKKPRMSYVHRFQAFRIIKDLVKGEIGSIQDVEKVFKEIAAAA